MLKRILHHIECEIEATEDYIDSAFDKKHCSKTTADLFAKIAGEEIDHAERLLKQGEVYLKELQSEEAIDAKLADHEHKMQIIWEWEKEKYLKKIAALKLKIEGYKAM